MGDLPNALEKYGLESSEKEIVEGLRSGIYANGLNPMTEAPIFQNYLISLLNLKSNGTLSTSLQCLKDAVEKFSASSTESARALNHWTEVLARATRGLVVATIGLGIVALIEIFF